MAKMFHSFDHTIAIRCSWPVRRVRSEISQHLHLCSGECKVKQIDVLLLMCAAGSSRDCRNSLLYQPSQRHLCTCTTHEPYEQYAVADCANVGDLTCLAVFPAYRVSQVPSDQNCIATPTAQGHETLVGDVVLRVEQLT